MASLTFYMPRIALCGTPGGRGPEGSLPKGEQDGAASGVQGGGGIM